jgi:hypothetical protein
MEEDHYVFYTVIIIEKYGNGEFKILDRKTKMLKCDDNNIESINVYHDKNTKKEVIHKHYFNK